MSSPRHWFKIALLAWFLWLETAFPVLVFAQKTPADPSGKQPVEFNVQVKPGSASATWLRTRAEAASPALLRDTRAATHLSGCQQVQALATVATRNSGFPSGETKALSNTLAACYTLRFPNASPAEAAAKAAALQASGEFAWIEPNRSVALHAALASAPDDPRIAEQWYHSYVQTYSAWDSTRGSSAIVIGILDTGLDYGHPEFTGQVAIRAAEDRNGNGTFEPWADTTLIGGLLGDLDGIDQDGNGYADDVIGYDFTDQPRSPFGGDYLGPDPDPADDNNHGTLVAGIVGAKADNQFGGAGIAPGCRLLVLRAFSGNGSGEDDDIARAIVYAADNGVHVLNMSFGDIYPSQMMHAAIRYAAARGVVLVGSAGNGTGDQLHYPSSFDEVISVGASSLNFDGTSEILWPLSSFGHTVSLVAPGSNILCPTIRDSILENSFDFFSGTSCSAPMVSAAVSLLFSQRGICTPQQVRGILCGSADDINAPGWDHYTGAGRLNIRAALQAPAAANVQLLSPANDGGSAAPNVWVIGTALDPLFRSAQLSYQIGVLGSENWIDFGTALDAQVAADTLGNWQIASLADGEYTLRLTVQRSDGSTLEDRIRFVIDRSPPVIALRHLAPAWDNDQRKLLWVYRSSDRGQVSLRVRPLGASSWTSFPQDRSTRNGAFLLDAAQLPSSPFEYQLIAVNEAGLSAATPLDTLTFTPAYLSTAGIEPTGMALPMGHYLSATQDFDGDGLREVVMSAYNDNLGFGRLKTYEYNAAGFTAIDSLAFKPVLIPKDIADADGDGLLELLCSVNDSLFITEQAGSGQAPSNVVYSRLGLGDYASRFADTDGDGDLELLTKDLIDHKIYSRIGNDYSLSATLPDVSGNYIGSVAPLTLVADFDQDSRPDIVFGDFDGDLLVYEHTAANDYAVRFIDSTTLTHSGSYLAQGDFDGDGREDIFVAAHAPLNRNEEDFEYEPAFWWLRIFSANADNTYEVVWQDYLYDIDTEDYNAATAVEIDQDPATEILFSTFPRTYLIEHNAGQYGISWFHYGALQTHHVADDFDGDGIPEFTLGRGDTAFFWQKDLSYAGPLSVAYLDGEVLDSNRTRLTWSASPNASAYLIWRGRYDGPGTVQIAPIDSTVALTYSDSGLVPGQRYLYVIENKNTLLSPAYSPFSYAILLRPHSPARLLGATALDASSLRLNFDAAVTDCEGCEPLFLLDGQEIPRSIVGGADGSSSLLLSFDVPFDTGSHQITVDAAFRDAERGRLDPAYRTASFTWQPADQASAYFANWKIRNPQSASISFNVPMDDDIRDVALWQIQPFGRIAGIEWADASQLSVHVQVDGVALGALGYPVSLTLTGGHAQSGAPMREKEGNTATFTEFKPDLTGVYVYPNPYRQHDLFQGIRFANLTRSATIHILSASGRKVITLTEADGDGGLDWNLIDVFGERIRPGTYLFKVEAEDVEPFIGKFSILE
jgi:hypothetical protein